MPLIDSRQPVRRRPALMGLVALLLSFLSLPASAQTQTNTQVTQRAVNFLSSDVATWTTTNNCIACHRQGAALYGLANARANGYDMNVVTANGSTNLANLELLGARTQSEQLPDGSWLHQGSYYRHEKTSYSTFGLAGYDQNVSTQFSSNQSFSIFVDN